MMVSLTAIFLLIVLSALVSCFETSITAASRAKVHRMASEGDKRAKVLEKILKEKERVVSVMLLTNNIANIVISAVATKFLLDLFGEIGVVYATIILTIVIIVFGEILPKTYAIKSPEKIALTFVWLISFLFKFFSPVVFLVQKIVGLFVHVSNVQKSQEAELEEIRDAVDLKAREGSIFKYDKDLLDGVLDLSDTEISEIMVHRKDIESINVDLSVSEIIKQATSGNYTRIPLWRSNKENIVSILNVRKLLKSLYFYKGDIDKFEIAAVVSEPWFVPATNSLRSQLFTFRKKKKHFALVIDEYGSLLGLVTLEDILEEIVGEMKEYDIGPEVDIIKIKSGAYKITGKTLIRDINKKLDWNLKEADDAHNLAAFVINHLGRIPEERETLVIEGFYFEILKRRNHDLVLIKVKNLLPHKNLLKIS